MTSAPTETVDEDFEIPFTHTSLTEAEALQAKPARRHLRDRLMTFAELAAIQPPEPLVEGLLYSDTLAQLTGPPGTYKSFFAMAMACCVATGRDFHDRFRTGVSGPVVYVVAEGSSSTAPRVAAWSERHGMDPNEVTRNLLILPEPIQIGDTVDITEALEVVQEVGAKLLVIDTRARCTLGLDENTMIVHLTDHGYLLGEHDLLGKPGDLLGNLYEPTCRVGMFIRHPEGLGAGRRYGAIVQPPDVMPTILDYLAVPVPPTVQGHSLLPLLSGEVECVRDVAYSGRFIYERPEGVVDTSTEFDGMAGSHSQVCSRTVSTEQWAYIAAPYDMPSELYDLEEDPAQEENVIAEYPEVAEALHRALIAFLEEHSVPEPGIAPFRHLTEE